MTIGGSGEAGKTCPWHVVSDLARETGKGHLRLRSTDAKLVGRSIGQTHVAIATVTGRSANLRLTYQVYRTDTGALVGPSIKASGNRSAIVRALPDVAKKLFDVIGVSGVRFPTKVVESPEILATLGTFPWSPPNGFESADDLDRLSLKSPLGNLMYVANRINVKDSSILIDAVDVAQRLAPNDLLVLGEISRESMTGNPILESLRTNVERLQKRFPNNFLANYSQAALAVGKGDYAAGRPSLERATRCATRGPFAWLALARNYSGQSASIRKGVTANKMTEGQVQTTQSLYEKWAEACAKAVELDPMHPTAWIALSSASAFAGDADTADEALTRAIMVELDNPLPDSHSLFEWGLQLYHPKWHEDSSKAKQLVERAVSQATVPGNDWPRTSRAEVALRVALLGYGEAAARIASDPESRRNLRDYLDVHRDEMVNPSVHVPEINPQ